MPLFLHRYFSLAWVASNAELNVFFCLYYDSLWKCRSGDKWTAAWEIFELMGAILAPIVLNKRQVNVAPLPLVAPHMSR